MKKIGIIGWRGMVGSVLMDRLKTEVNFKLGKFFLFSTTQAKAKNQVCPSAHDVIMDANNISELMEMDILITCQGGDYTKAIHPKLRESQWKGYWIDAASALRLQEDTTLILDPINHDQLLKSIRNGNKDFVGANCTVSLMLIALGGLFKENLVEWVTSMTYQAASGAGAQNMIELIEQFSSIGEHYKKHPSLSALEYEKEMQQLINKSEQFPKKHFGHPLALNLLPWIDSELPSGQSKEEWKAAVEASKLLERDVIIDGTCVRVGALRCHSQAFTIKLRKNLDIKSIEKCLTDHNPWVQVVANTKEETLAKLTPAAVSGTLNIAIGRIRKMLIGEEYINAFCVGDQLLWGAAEPLRRMLVLLLKEI